ncbi:protein transport protein SEC61 subunit gamma [Nematocida homosporus]|uniref:protein transport protein SEC61 subunit gamma n=1 Tax=Nematocida homosporus TaxID=1912981 RepID=UPI00221F60CD|nr:protein transport protein SEC61 subunit gamma [Nematocida homosporus]KAI5186736.1 protein transport protein SEC61 subunit gamma [Nematocida homosporus]
MSESRRRVEVGRRSVSAKAEKMPVGLVEGFWRQVRLWQREMIHVRLFLKRATKPSKREYVQLVRAHATGVLLLGFLGYVITFIHIPINNILFGVKR